MNTQSRGPSQVDPQLVKANFNKSKVGATTRLPRNKICQYRAAFSSFWLALMHHSPEDYELVLQRVLQVALDQRNEPLNTSTKNSECLAKLSETGIGLKAMASHLIDEIVPNCDNSRHRRYFGFVTGSSTSAALIGDILVSILDQNVQVNQMQTICTDLEEHTGRLVADLFRLASWHVTFTTGATSGNLLGLALGRFVTGAKKVLVADPHSSVRKVCKILGLEVVACSGTPPFHEFDLQKLQSECNEPCIIGYKTCLNIVDFLVSTLGTVNTGSFANLQVIPRANHIWIHVDAAFGLFARLLPELKHLTMGLEETDSISSDAHKYLNVPYDSGFFLTRHRKQLGAMCGNDSPYLGDGPLNYGVENSRRFRALPVYASLVAYGSNAYVDLVRRTINIAREIARGIVAMPSLTLLNPNDQFNIVVFCANQDSLNDGLLRSINQTGEVFCTGTVLQDRKAVRVAVAGWETTLEDAQKFLRVLQSVTD